MGRQRWLAPSVAITVLIAIVASVVWQAPSGGAVTAQQSSPAAGTPVASPVASPFGSPQASPVAFLSDDPTFASGPFRVTLTSAERGAAFPALDLEARDGREWYLVTADVANWGSEAGTLPPRGFGIAVQGSPDVTGIAPRSTQLIAKQLGIEPLKVNTGVPISPGSAQRIVLAFLVDEGGVNPTLRFEDEVIPLDPIIGLGRTAGSLPPLSTAPVLEPATVTGVPDGQTLSLPTGDVRLIGVDSPRPEECFGGQAISRLKRLAGDDVLIQRDTSDPAAVWAWAPRADGSLLLLNREAIGNGYAVLEPGVTGPYTEWITATAEAAKARNAGLWEGCTSAHGVSRPKGADLRTLTIKPDGVERPYEVWVAWSPLLVTKPDGGAWAFFSATATEGDEAGNKRLYASRFDPTTGTWTAGLPMPGGQVQMGASGAVDDQGLVHLVYIDRAEDAEGVFSQILYTKEDGQGGWIEPVAVSTSPDAGFQLSPALTIDQNGVVHVLWQDQRGFGPEARASLAANADIFASDLTPGGEWSKPVMVNTHFADAVGSRPDVVVDGDRLVAVWSVYAAALGLDSAARIEWATRPLDDPTAWSTPKTLVVGRGESFGGRLLDLAADPNGGAVFVYGRQANDTFLFMRRLAPGGEEWSGDTLITFGDRGAFPSAAVALNGTTYIAYNAGVGATVDVGGVAVPFRSLEPGPEVILTRDYLSTQGRPIVAADVASRPWLIFFNEPAGGVANQVMVLRNAPIPATVEELEQILSEPTATPTEEPSLTPSSTEPATATVQPAASSTATPTAQASATTAAIEPRATSTP